MECMCILARFLHLHVHSYVHSHVYSHVYSYVYSYVYSSHAYIIHRLQNYENYENLTWPREVVQRVEFTSGGNVLAIIVFVHGCTKLRTLFLPRRESDVCSICTRYLTELITGDTSHHAHLLSLPLCAHHGKVYHLALSTAKFVVGTDQA